jgi:hypothetical protein
MKAMHRVLSHTAVLLSAAIATSGCGTQSTKPTAGPDAAFINYQLPVSAAQLTLNLTLTECGPAPKGKGTVALTPVVRPSPFPEHYFHIKGADLASFTKKRELKIDLYPNGAIKTVNASVADRTGAILANVLKLATAAAAFDAATPRLAKIACNAKTAEAIRDVDSIRTQVQQLQKALASGSAADPTATRKQIDALAAERGRLQADKLTIALTRTIEFWSETKGGVVRWKGEQLAQWFDGVGLDTLDHFSLGWCVQKQSDTAEPTCDAATAQGSHRAPGADASGSAKIACASDQCAKTLVFREPVNAVLTLVAMRDDLGSEADSQLAQATLPIAQWGEVSYFPLQAGFADSKSLSLALDEFGRRTSFGWTSEARGESLTGGVQTIADAALGFKTARDGADMAAKKAELDALETQQKLNELRRCQAVLDAGGFVCPEQ